MISSGRSSASGGTVVDPNPALISQLADMTAQRNTAITAQAAAVAALTTAQDLAVRIPTSWTTYSWRWNSNPTLAGAQAIQHDAAAPGLTTFSDAGKTCLRCSVSSTQATVSSGKRAELVFNNSNYVMRAGDRLRVKFGIRFDLSSGRWVSNANWAVVTQIHGYLASGSPPVSIEIHGDRIRIRIMPDYHDQRVADANNLASGVVWSGSVAAFASAWQTFEYTIQWGLDDNSAWIEATLNGTPLFSRTYMKNMLFDVQDLDTGAVAAVDASHEYVGEASPGYFKLGLYQNPTIGLRAAEYRDMEVDVMHPVY